MGVVTINVHAQLSSHNQARALKRRQTSVSEKKFVPKGHRT